MFSITYFDLNTLIHIIIYIGHIMCDIRQKLYMTDDNHIHVNVLIIH